MLAADRDVVDIGAPSVKSAYWCCRRAVAALLEAGLGGDIVDRRDAAALGQRPR